MKPNLRKSEVRRMIRLDQLGGFVAVEVRGETPVFRRLQKRRLVDRLGIYGWQLSNLGREVLDFFRKSGRGEGWVYVHHCPQCGSRGWLEGVDAEGAYCPDIYCPEPGCPHAARVRALDERRGRCLREGREGAREAEEKKRAEAFEEYEERLRRNR